MNKKLPFRMIIALLAVWFIGGLTPTKAEDGKSLLGNWTFERVEAFKDNVQQTFSVDDCNCEVPVSMDIRQDEIAFEWKNGAGTAQYNAVVRESAFCFCPCAEWKIADNKLQLQWTQDIEGEEPKLLTIVITYKLK